MLTADEYYRIEFNKTETLWTNIRICNISIYDNTMNKLVLSLNLNTQDVHRICSIIYDYLINIKIDNYYIDLYSIDNNKKYGIRIEIVDREDENYNLIIAETNGFQYIDRMKLNFFYSEESSLYNLFENLYIYFLNDIVKFSDLAPEFESYL